MHSQPPSVNTGRAASQVFETPVRQYTLFGLGMDWKRGGFDVHWHCEFFVTVILMSTVRFICNPRGCCNLLTGVFCLNLIDYFWISSTILVHSKRCKMLVIHWAVYIPYDSCLPLSDGEIFLKKATLIGRNIYLYYSILQCLDCANVIRNEKFTSLSCIRKLSPRAGLEPAKF